MPHRTHLEQLILVLPENYREQMVTLLRKDIPDFSPPQILPPHPLASIPEEFYFRTTRLLCETEQSILFSTALQLLVQQIVSQLQGRNDQLRIGLFILTPPSKLGAPVRTLHMPLQPSGIRSAAFTKTFPLFAGLESHLHYALRSPGVIRFPVDEMRLPIQLVPELKRVKDSCMLSIQRQGKVAGVLVVSSEVDGFFVQAAKVLQAYGYLIALSFPEARFFAPSEIHLGVVPSATQQYEKEQLFPFHERVQQAQGKVLADALASESHPEDLLSLTALERVALLELEAELLADTNAKVGG
jgi:hypothetical protein